MNRLPLELDRLYGIAAKLAEGSTGDRVDEPRGGRVLVLELAQPGTWAQLSAVWQGVQADLDLPAPAIAVSGADGLQLWFALATPVSRSSGLDFLEGLRARYLGDVAASRVRLSASASECPPAPALEVAAERWSAFVAPDLASVFADTPWLDLPPSDDGQATLLRALAPMAPAAFAAASARLAAGATAAPASPPTSQQPAELAPTFAGHAGTDPVRFLTNVMNDAAAPLALRIDAARALLPYTGQVRGSEPGRG